MNDWIDLIEELAGESGKLILRYFGSQIHVERKADKSPVTVADREAEDLMRRIIEARYPEHQVRGEEHGISGPRKARYQWLLDPIDGTKSFIHGVPLFCTLIALLEDGRPILGAIHLPVTGELLLGVRGRVTTLAGSPVRVSAKRQLSQASVVYTSTRGLWAEGHGRAYQELQERVEIVRGWGDGYGHFMVATGRADVMIDPVLCPWDIAALKPCVEGAGGRFTDLKGVELDLGESALSTNGHLHEQVLAILNPP